MPPETVGDGERFTATSTSSAAYLAWRVRPYQRPHKPQSDDNFLGADPTLKIGTTVHRDVFTDLSGMSKDVPSFGGPPPSQLYRDQHVL